MCSNKTVQKIRVTELKNEMNDIQIKQRKTLYARVDVVATLQQPGSSPARTTRPQDLARSSLNQASIKPQASASGLKQNKSKRDFRLPTKRQWARRLPDISY
jgi:hypothetical protein